MERPVDQTGEELDIEPAQPGTRSDGAGASVSSAGAAPSGGDARVNADRSETAAPDETRSDPSVRGATRSEPKVPAGNATGAGGGYGTGSEQSSGGTGEGETDANDDPQTEWLRDAPGGPADG